MKQSISAGTMAQAGRATRKAAEKGSVMIIPKEPSTLYEASTVHAQPFAMTASLMPSDLALYSWYGLSWPGGDAVVQSSSSLFS